MSEHPAVDPTGPDGDIKHQHQSAFVKGDAPCPDCPGAKPAAKEVQDSEAARPAKKRSRKLKNKCALCGSKLSARRVAFIYLVTYQCDTCKDCICHDCSCDRTKHRCLQDEIDAAVSAALESDATRQDKILRKLDRV